jgi:hypothetical protein
VADPTIQVAGVITRRRPGITLRQRGITSQHRAITISQGSINRRRAITISKGVISRHRVITRRGAIIGVIRIMGGTVITEVAGTMTPGVVDAITNTAGAATTTVRATKTVKAITAAEAATVNLGQAQYLWERAGSLPHFRSVIR